MNEELIMDAVENVLKVYGYMNATSDEIPLLIAERKLNRFASESICEQQAQILKGRIVDSMAEEIPIKVGESVFFPHKFTLILVTYERDGKRIQ